MSSVLEINARVRIPMEEFRFRAVLSGGPGGQHVNKTASQVELRFSLDETESLTEHQKGRVRQELGTRINSAGEILLRSDRHRSQLRNREDVLERFRQLVAHALRPRTPRKKTKPTRASKEKRIQDKKRRSDTKRRRRELD